MTPKQPIVRFTVEEHHGVRVVVVREPIPIAGARRFAADAAAALEIPSADAVFSPPIALALGANFVIVSRAGHREWNAEAKRLDAQPGSG